MPSPDYGIQQTRCPHCGYRLDRVSNADQKIGHPEPGDTSICLNCGALLTFTPDLSLRQATAAEVRELMAEPDVWKLIDRVRLEISQRGQLPERMRR